MEGKLCLKTTTRVCMNDSQESRRQTKQHIVSHARTVLCIFHTMLISKSASFMLYICIVVHVMWFNQSIFYFLNQYAENDLIKKLWKNKTKTTKFSIHDFMNMYFNIIIDGYAFMLYNYVIKVLLKIISSESCLHMHNNCLLLSAFCLITPAIMLS
jgi:hypothetical protein